ncbi:MULTISPECIES: flavin reductase [unclassified Variovorax]|uniref:flavin reductase n=1 Tax=unclassified Variovorax TaxID=663243 RepID=UPI00076C0EF1|nr:MULTISPECIES: flavin reductase [unclassified Variovorax]KWT97948.1 flavin reductase-like, FMN-binding [Variovorax sp. WDL1]PNG59213.1 p-hydroxyphenylacetate 3-hydroxylase, reductase component [Variovorax sp. B4]PNG60996.1 p-hydroxyphenylacetate 3-hydroxylase, reductase component [Variovorax sp. B2]VTV13067.1 p-hydroxyphenylacetate 3-hydroxylase, reductase component [Variovorax sp. WDL1]
MIQHLPSHQSHAAAPLAAVDAATTTATVSAAFDKKQFREVLGTFVTGVTVVTTTDPVGRHYGVTANSFNSVSLDPPLVLWSQSITTSSYPGFRDSGSFAVNILADDQVHISNHFAKSADDKFQHLHYTLGIGNVPLLDGAAATLECTKVAAYPGGDHVVYIGRVERIARHDRRPLVFGGGKYMVAYSHDLGPGWAQPGSSRPASLESIAIAIEAMPGIARRLGDRTLCLAVWGNHGPTALHWEPSAMPVSCHLQPALVMSVTNSATGGAFAAFLPPEITSTFIDEELRQTGQVSGDRRRSFQEDVADFRRRGLARAVESQMTERLHGVTVNAFSAPIHGPDGEMVMALTVIDRATRLHPDWDGQVPKGLVDEAQAISARLRC